MFEFEEPLIIMKQVTQSGPAGPVISWFDGEEITGMVQLPSSLETQIAQAQGVKATGNLALDVEIAQKVKFNDYLRAPKRGRYIRIADDGNIESGEGVFKTKQYTVEAVQTLPR